MSRAEGPEKLEGSPKYRRIYTDLRHALTTGRYVPGDKLPSENELVEQFGASRPTVGRALAQLETEGMVERRPGSGTYVLGRHRNEGFIFGLLIPELGITEVFEPICRGISIARLGGYHDLLWGPTLSAGATKEAQAEQLCKYYVERGVSGVFFAPVELSGGKDEVNLRIARTLDDARIPIILLDRDLCEYPKRSKYDLVGIDNRRAGFVITEHLLRCGAQQIVFFARPNSAPTVGARSVGYREAVRAYGHGALQEFVEYGDPGDATTVRNLLSRCKPDAVVCANDYTAGLFMTTLNALGVRVPSEIRVTGMDDIRYASMLQTPLTTIHQPCLDLGAAALSAMRDRVSHPTMPARDLFVDFRLVIRRSTAADSQDVNHLKDYAQLLES
jgi:GntR family transcriptional regulator of arabinose operon